MSEGGGLLSLARLPSLERLAYAILTSTVGAPGQDPGRAHDDHASGRLTTPG